MPSITELTLEILEEMLPHLQSVAECLKLAYGPESEEADGIFDPTKGELIASAKMSYTFPPTVQDLVDRNGLLEKAGQHLHDALQTYMNEGRDLGVDGRLACDDVDDALHEWEDAH